jgi:hypothetical protein
MEELTILKGSDYVRTIKVFSRIDGIRSAYNLTGITVMFTVKNIEDNAGDDSAALIQKDITEHTNAAGGITVISLTDVETDISAGIYKADIRLFSEGGICFNTERFSLRVIDIVTKRTS